VELHEGTLSVSSEGRGRGATFAIRLPVAGVGVAAPGDAEGG
jgi:signal transduction histidine kinase